MKFSIKCSDILKPIEQVANCSDSTTQTEPITANVLIVVKKNDPSGSIKDANYSLKVACTDTEIEMMCEVGIFSDDNDVECGETTVQAKKILSLLKTFSSDVFLTIRLDEDKKSLIISSGIAKFDSHLVTLPAEQFPSIDSINADFNVKIKRSVLLELMRTTEFSIAEQNYRYFLKGMRFAINGDNLDIYAADGHRLSIQRGKLIAECNIPESYGDNGFIFPKKGVSELIRLLSLNIKENADAEIILFLSKNTLKTSIDGITLVSRLLEATYPDVLSVVPNSCTRFIIVDCDEFRRNLERVDILGNSVNHAVELVYKDGQLTVKAKNPLHEDATNGIDCEFTGDDFDIAYSALYFEDICKVMPTKKMRISMSSNSNNAKLEPFYEKDDKTTNQSLACYVVSRILL